MLQEHFPNQKTQIVVVSRWFLSLLSAFEENKGALQITSLSIVSGKRAFASYIISLFVCVSMCLLILSYSLRSVSYYLRTLNDNFFPELLVILVMVPGRIRPMSRMVQSLLTGLSISLSPKMVGHFRQHGTLRGHVVNNFL